MCAIFFKKMLFFAWFKLQFPNVTIKILGMFVDQMLSLKYLTYYVSLAFSHAPIINPKFRMALLQLFAWQLLAFSSLLSGSLFVWSFYPLHQLVSLLKHPNIYLIRRLFSNWSNWSFVVVGPWFGSRYFMCNIDVDRNECRFHCSHSLPPQAKWHSPCTWQTLISLRIID
jgi:hypothetical protein